jgi:hypothetical protein
MNWFCTSSSGTFPDNNAQLRRIGSMTTVMEITAYFVKYVPCPCTVLYEIRTSTNAPKIYIILFLKISYMFPSCWAETCRRFLRIKLYIFFGALVGVIIS